MSKMAHTRGPWKVEKELSSRSGEWLIALDAGDRGRGIAIAETIPATGKELYNARLIAAAPELLDALQGLVKELSDSDDEGLIENAEPMIAARVAIDKALGEAQ